MILPNIKKTGIVLQPFLVILCLFIFCKAPLNAQDEKVIDSILMLMDAHSKQDSNLVKLLNDLSWEYKIHDPAKARNLLDQAIQIAIDINFKKGQAQAYNNYGVVETIADRYKLSIEWYQQALIIREELGLQKGVASLYNNIGNLHDAEGDYFNALENYSKSLIIRQSLQDSIRVARAQYNISTTLYKMGNYPESLDNVFDYLQMVELLKDEEGIANAHNVIGNNKIELEQFEAALESYQKSLDIFERLNDEEALQNIYLNMGGGIDDVGEQFYKAGAFDKASKKFNEALTLVNKSLVINRKLEDPYAEGASLNTIGYIYKNIGSNSIKLEQNEKANEQFDTAFDFLQQSLTIRKELDDKIGIMEVYNGMGDVKRRKGDLKASKKYAEDYLSLAKEVNSEKYIQDGYKDLAKIYEAEGNYKQAFEFLSSYEKLKYQRLNDKVAQENARREVIYSDKKKQHAMQEEIYKRNAKLERAEILRNSLIGGALALLLLAALLYNRYRIKHRANVALDKKNRIIAQEQKRSEDLLLNILPKATAEELKQNGKANARYYESVTVLFTDFVSFTKIAEELSPEELVAELDKCFKAFDDIIEKHGIEKIKTIGDAYMCAGGLPVPTTNHAKRVVAAAIDICHFMDKYQKERRNEGKKGFEIRIGVHSGPVVSGIVGNKKFAYDIWGDTVNIAARMESSGEAGKVNVSKSTYELVKKDFEINSRGKIQAKNKGLMDMYFVLGRKLNTF